MSALNFRIDQDGQVSPDLANLGLCSGFGQWHSPNNERDPQPYISTTMAQIRALIDNPPSVDKSKGQWTIFSTLASRVHSEQREHGQFVALWADIDDCTGFDFEAATLKLCALLHNAGFMAYTSRSATAENPKLRIIVPLTAYVAGSVFVRLQKILNDKLQKAGIAPDRATERAGQVCFLPNRGEFWDYHVKDGDLDPSLWSNELSAEIEREKAEKQAQTQRQEQARLKAAQRMKAGTQSPIDAYNETYPVELMLESCGYTRRGKRWLSPKSESGVPGVSINDDGGKWFSQHGSDSQIGKATETGTMGDSFDLFVFYRHGGNREAAIKEAARMFAVNEINQPEPTMLEAPDTEQPAFDLSQFAMNGQAATMEAQMLDDKFVLGRMAILGQSSVFYAKPNAGKTLLVLWLVIEGIKSGEVNGQDVFYINADDNHKGLVFKLRLAEKHGFQMLAPGYNGFKSPQLPGYLLQLVKENKAQGKILILDTVKKFTDLMKKDKASQFGECVRQFVSHGGTVIMLAHVNKHRDEDQKVIYSGTSDLVDDADCAYTLDTVTEDAASGLRTVKFENFKARGDVASEAVYRYNYADGTHYQDRLHSVEEVGEAERKQADKRKRLDAMLERNRDAVGAIKDVIREGVTKKTDLIKEAHERSGIAKQKITRALNDHTGSTVAEHQFWHLNVADKNAHVYQLNWGIS